MPLAQSIPKHSYYNGAYKKEYAIVNLEELNAPLRARHGCG